MVLLWLVACGGSSVQPAAPIGRPVFGQPWVAEGAQLPPELRCEAEGHWRECFISVPAATLPMGAAASDEHAEDQEGPQVQVAVGAFRIHAYEVTVEEHQACVHAGWCDASAALSDGGFSNAGQPERRDHPINSISWSGAVRYCTWLGARLPTESEWELAARGTDGRLFPWGPEPGCGVAPRDGSKSGGGDVVVCEGGGTSNLGGLRGKSPYGLWGTAGNVWEWTSTPYLPDLHERLAAGQGMPEQGEIYALRGGAWTAGTPWELRSTVRGGMLGSMRVNDTGFRCARDR